MARAARPKQFLPLFGGKTLLRLTYERIAPLVGRNNVVVVAGAVHRSLLRHQLPEVSESNLILEDMGRNTAVSVALAALWIRARHRDGVMVVLPADHWINPVAVFRSTIRIGIGAARRNGGLVTIGVRPRSPETGFGYIRLSPKRVAPGVIKAAAFIEKPSLRRARRLIKSGGFLWNSGIFVWRVTSILEELERHTPRMMRPLRAWADVSRRRRVWRVPAQLLRRIIAIPIDRAVMERSKRVGVVRAAFRWSDLGTWSAFGDLLSTDRNGNAGLGVLLSVDSHRCLGINRSGVSVFVGVRDLIVIREGEVVVVCSRHDAQRIRTVVNNLRGPLRRLL